MVEETVAMVLIPEHNNVNGFLPIVLMGVTHNTQTICTRKDIVKEPNSKYTEIICSLATRLEQYDVPSQRNEPSMDPAAMQHATN